MKECSWVVSIAILTVFTFLPSQNCHPGLLKKPLAFQQFTQKDGLSSEMVYAIAAADGEVWFGTYGGGAIYYDKAKKP